MRLLLTHGYFLDEDAKEQQIMKPYPPLGLLYLSSHLRRAGLDVSVYDSTFGTREELRCMLGQGDPGVLGIAANLMTRPSAVRIIEDAKAAGWFVVAGGPEPANYIPEYLAAGADVVVIGEGERTLEELMRARETGAPLDRIDGIAFRAADGSIRRTAPRALIADLDAQPWPDRERIDMDRYLASWRARHGAGSVSVITARGCPYRCRWCSHSTFGMTHRRRSARAVADEVEWILGRYHPEMLWFADDVFTIHHGWIDEYADQVRRRGLRVPFECITRADRLNPRIAARLAELGCFRVWIGSESGSERVLAAMERGVTPVQVRDAVGWCRAEGIQTGMFLMWGYEGEEVADIQATVEHVKACRPDVFLTTIAYPIKGTPYYAQAAPRLAPPAEWRLGTDRDFRVLGRHSRRFYGFADQWLRSEFASAHGPASERERLRVEATEAQRGLRESFEEREA